MIYLGIDVGTQSARVGAFDHTGSLLAHQVKSITTLKNDAGHLSQSSTEIWQCVKQALQSVITQGQLDVATIASIGVSATCSLVLHGKNLRTELNGQDIILWQCHRAKEQAQQINATNYSLLKRLGGTISPEHEIPKLMWLKQYQTEIFTKADYFFDLADWLTFKLTASPLRSVCTTTCKWGFNGNGNGWDDDFFRSINLGELVDENYKRIGNSTQIVSVGTCVGTLSPSIAKELHLNTEIVVAAGMIDAHAGALGVLGISSSEMSIGNDVNKKLAVIAGTSTCHMAVSDQELFVPGVWGPFPNAILPNMSLTEGGISASGDLLHKIIINHQASQGKADQAMHQQLCKTITQLQQQECLAWPEYLCTDLHILPFFHGNRSPYADPDLRGTILGLTMEGGLNELAKLYYSTILALAYNDKAIFNAMNANGHQIETVIITGGLTKNPLMMAANANATGLPIVVPKETESVLLGCAISARIAKTNENPIEVMTAMSQAKEVILPSQDPQLIDFHKKKYQVFLMLKQQQHAINTTMHSA